MTLRMHLFETLHGKEGIIQSEHQNLTKDLKHTSEINMDKLTKLSGFQLKYILNENNYITGYEDQIRKIPSLQKLPLCKYNLILLLKNKISFFKK